MTQLKALFSESTLKNVAQAGLTKFPDKRPESTFHMDRRHSE
jgi:hypothetical protein